MQRQQKRGSIGFVYKSQIDNNIGKVYNYSNVPRYSESIASDKPIDMSGDGFMDIIKSVYEKGKQGAKFLYENKDKIADVYSGEIGTTLKNLTPSSDATARDSFVGEKHGILQLPNGKYGVANYLGPNTNLIERLRRGDPPRTEVDKASQAHDIRYALAKNTDDIRKADNIMMNTVDRIARNRGDNPKNIAQARLIKAKIIGEDMGLIRKDAFSGDLSNKFDISMDDKDRITLMSKIGSLAHEGYGLKKVSDNQKLSMGQGVKMLPGDALKMKLLKQMVRDEKLKGGKITGESMTKDLGNPYLLINHPTGGSGIMDFVVNNILPSLMKNLGIPAGLISQGKLKDIISKSLEMVQSGNIKSIIEHLSKTILPILIHLKNKSMGGDGLILSGQGSKVSKNFQGNKIPKAHKTKTKIKLIKSLSKGLKNSFKQYLKMKKRKTPSYIDISMRGRGIMIGAGFWDDFKKGFLSVFKPGAKILGGVLDAVGMPEFGIPLGLLGEHL